jgi:CRISPR system Cascade subunit CasB
MSATYLSFDKDSPEMRAFTAWWQALDDNRGDRSELRRCSTVVDVAFTPAYHRLRLSVLKFGAPYDDGLALLAGLSVRVKNDLPEQSFSEQMATGKSDGSARVSGLRFRRLLKVSEPDALLIAMGRVIALLGSSANLQSLAKSVYFWNDRTRKQWALEYYSASPSEK